MTRTQSGFTLIELLIVVVIIGILAAIAIPRFSATRERAYYTAMKSDLKNFVSQQEIFYTEGYTYSADAEELGFSASPGVVLGTITADVSGWSVTATHQALGASDGCAIYFGDVTPPTIPGGDAVDQPGVVQCNR
jgi:type IV pilus assembly protein PilA